MAGPLFYLQIVDRDHAVVIDPFTAGPMELELIETIVTDIVGRGVGLFATSAHVEQDVRDGLITSFQRLKTRTTVVALQS